MNKFSILGLAFMTTIITCNVQGADKKFQKLDAIPLWSGKKVDQKEIDKTLKEKGFLQNVTKPFIIAYLPPKDKATGTSLLICPGGGYGALGWLDHVERLAPFFTSRGIAVIGLGYRTNDPKNKMPDDALKDLNQAIKLIRRNAKAWNLDEDKIVGVGFSAGSNLLLQYACSPDGEKIKYINFLCLWPFFRKANTYEIKKKGLDVILFIGEKDTVAPPAFSVEIADMFKKSGGKAKLIKNPNAVHSSYNFVLDRPVVDWTEDFLKWLNARELLDKK